MQTIRWVIRYKKWLYDCKGYGSWLVGVITSIVFIMVGIRVSSLKRDEVGRVPRRLRKHGTCGARVHLFMGQEEDVTGETGVMRDFINDVEGNEGANFVGDNVSAVQNDQHRNFLETDNSLLWARTRRKKGRSIISSSA